MAERRGERGQTIILVAISIVSLLAMAALAIDVITLYVARSEIRRAADAAALAGAQAIADSGATTLALTNPNFATAQAMANTMATNRVTAITPINLVAGGTPTISTPSVDWSRQGNPIVTVQVQQNVPTYFARLWGHTSTSLSATAVAEVYNPGNNPSYTPIAPSAVKPWLVPNIDPKQSTSSTTSPFVNITTGDIELNVVGERFDLVADCSACLNHDSPPKWVNNNQEEYLPAVVTPDTVKNVCPSCSGATDFERSIECADMVTSYSCGINTAQVDTTTNPSGVAGPSATGAECLIHATGAGIQGQDSLNNVIPFPNSPPQIIANSGSYSGLYVSTSTSIVTIPIVDQTAFPNVNIVGYLQAFINQVQPVNGVGINAGDIDITVLNVSGCGGASNGKPPVVGGSGTSPVPVRLISPPTP